MITEHRRKGSGSPLFFLLFFLWLPMAAPLFFLAPGLAGVRDSESYEKARNLYLKAIETLERSSGKDDLLKALELFEAVPPIAEGIEGAQELAAAALVQAASIASGRLGDRGRARRDLEAVVDLYPDTSWIGQACSSLSDINSGRSLGSLSTERAMEPLKKLSAKVSWTKWTWPARGVSMDRPEQGWQMIGHGSGDPVVFHIMGKKPTSPANPGYPNITLAWEESSLDLQEYFSRTGSELKGMSSWKGAMEILSEGPMDGEVPGMVRVFLCQIRGCSVTHVQAYVSAGRGVLMFTLADLEPGLVSSRPLFDHMLRSLRVNP